MKNIDSIRIYSFFFSFAKKRSSKKYISLHIIFFNCIKYLWRSATQHSFQTYQNLFGTSYRISLFRVCLWPTWTLNTYRVFSLFWARSWNGQNETHECIMYVWYDKVDSFCKEVSHIFFIVYLLSLENISYLNFDVIWSYRKIADDEDRVYLLHR